MLGQNLSQPWQADPELAVRRQIHARTWGRVVITGLVPSYYYKQLVLLAVTEARKALGGLPVEAEIQVTDRVLRPPAEGDAF